MMDTIKTVHKAPFHFESPRTQRSAGLRNSFIKCLRGICRTPNSPGSLPTARKTKENNTLPNLLGIEKPPLTTYSSHRNSLKKASTYTQFISQLSPQQPEIYGASLSDSVASPITEYNYHAERLSQLRKEVELLSNSSIEYEKLLTSTNTEIAQLANKQVDMRKEISEMAIFDGLNIGTSRNYYLKFLKHSLEVDNLSTLKPCNIKALKKLKSEASLIRTLSYSLSCNIPTTQTNQKGKIT